MRAWFDGGCREGRAGAGCWLEAAKGKVGRVLKGRDSLDAESYGDWVFVAGAGAKLKSADGDSLAAELCSAGF